MAGTTLNSMFQESAARAATRVALMHKVEGRYADISYRDLAQRVEQMASGLAALGVVKGDRVALLSENRPEWAVTDLAVLALGAINVPLYTTLPSPQIAYILRNSGAKAIVLSDAKQLSKVLKAREETPELKYIVTMDADPPEGDAMVRTYASVDEMGRQTPLGAEYEKTWKAVRPDDVASIVYTSGTTGDPKGAMLTHKNFVADADAAIKHFNDTGLPITEEDTFLSFLPLCHVYERTTGYYLPLRVGGSIGYAESIFAVQSNMAEVKPTLMVSVPRLYESMQERILDTVGKAPKKRQEIFHKALAVAMEHADRKRNRRLVGPILAIKHAVFNKLVFSKIRDRFGGRIRVFVSGGAALSNDTALFFDAIGIPILQGYGMTEASPCISVHPANQRKVGTVGVPLPGVQVKIADDGEILVKGDILMKGYWDNPQATADAIDKNGWLHTGDIGEMDRQNFIKITDRKKDIVVLANGKNVAPQPIESALKESPFIGELVLIGDRQNVITALIVPNLDRLRDWAKDEKLAFDTNEELIALPEARRKIKQEIDAHSGHLADFEKIKKFTLLPRPFSVEAGELTPTLKVKRKVVAQKYADAIAEMRGDTVAA